MGKEASRGGSEAEENLKEESKVKTEDILTRSHLQDYKSKKRSSL